MRETKQVILCDICKQEIEETVAIENGRNFVIKTLEVDGKDNHYFVEDICATCNTSLLNKFFDVMSGKV